MGTVERLRCSLCKYPVLLRPLTLHLENCPKHDPKTCYACKRINQWAKKRGYKKVKV